MPILRSQSTVEIPASRGRNPTQWGRCASACVTALAVACRWLGRCGLIRPRNPGIGAISEISLRIHKGMERHLSIPLLGCCGWVGGGGCRMLLRVVAHWRLRVAWLRRVHGAIRERGGGSRRRCALLQHVSADLCRTYNVNTWPRNAEAKGSIDRCSSVEATRADGRPFGCRGTCGIWHASMSVRQNCKGASS